MKYSKINQMKSTAAIDPVSFHFADFICRHFQATTEDQAQVFAMLSNAVTNKNTCLDLNEISSSLSLPVEQLTEMMASHPFVDDKGTNTPVIQRGTLLFLKRFFVLEKSIAEDLINRNKVLPTIDNTSHFFPEELSHLDDGQKVALALALTRQLAILTGGAGTGKTMIIAELLRLLSANGQALSRVKLTAPTGKAAKRLDEALGEIRGIVSDLPMATTLHRLLGMSLDGRRHLYNAENPLKADVIVVDEASMLDLSLTGKLIEAMPADCRLVLVGDPYQLPSVEIGNLLADICAPPCFDEDYHQFIESLTGVSLETASGSIHPLQNAHWHLSHSYRFASGSGIDQLASAVLIGKRDKVEELLHHSDEEINFHTEDALSPSIIEDLSEIFLPYLQALQQQSSPEQLLNLFEKSRVLSLRREGQRGVETINRLIEASFAERSLLDTRNICYRGRPVLVTRNDYALNLFNGDIGICLPGSDDHLNVYFLDTQGSARMIDYHLLPPHETCFAMTVHKAQGSEYDSVSLVLPDDSYSQDRELMVRESLYAAITRSRNQLGIFGRKQVFLDAMERHNKRKGGLSHLLLKPDSN